MDIAALTTCHSLYLLNVTEDAHFPISRKFAVTPDVYQDAILWNERDSTRTQNFLTQEYRSNSLYSQVYPSLCVMNLNEYKPLKLKALIHERFPRTARGMRIVSFSLTRTDDDQIFLLDYDFEDND